MGLVSNSLAPLSVSTIRAIDPLYLPRPMCHFIGDVRLVLVESGHFKAHSHQFSPMRGLLMIDSHRALIILHTNGKCVPIPILAPPPQKNHGDLALDNNSNNHNSSSQ